MKILEIIQPDKLAQYKQYLGTDNDTLATSLLRTNALVGAVGGGDDSYSYSSIFDKILGGGSSFNSGKKAVVNRNEVFNYLKSKGLDDNHIIGILENIKDESNFDAGNMSGDGGRSWGLFQYGGNRRNDMVRYCGKNWQSNWKGQIDFALSENEGQQYLSRFFKNPFEAIKWWLLNFERPSKSNQLARLATYDKPQYKNV